MPTLVCFAKTMNSAPANQEQDNVHIACLRTPPLFLRYRSARTAERQCPLAMTLLFVSGHSISASARKRSLHIVSCAVKVYAALSGARTVALSSQQVVTA